MKKLYAVIVLFLAIYTANAQSPCQVTLDSIYLDSSLSDCSHLFFKFDLNGGPPSSYYWTYGDGNSCTCIKPKNVYRQNGLYEVCGVVKDQNACADTQCISVEVNCTNPCDLSGIGIFSMDTLSYSCNEMEFITITSNNAKKIRWDFGDGDSADTDYTIHTYQENGNYRVQLIIMDSIACADTSELYVKIDCPTVTPCNLIISKIDTSYDNDCKTVFFDLKANHKLSQVDWDFGDGNSKSSNAIEKHQYMDTGLFEVCAIAKDSLNCLDTICLTVSVSCPPSTAIEDFKLSELVIYPSPFKSELNIKINEAVTMRLFDAGMRQILSRDLPSGESAFDLKNLQSGLYFILIETPNRIDYYPVIKE